jgi:membrane-associated phospholipid phosphatase
MPLQPTSQTPDSPRKPLGFIRARLSPEGYLGLHLTMGMAVLLLAMFVFGHIAEDVVTGDSSLLLDARAMHWLDAHDSPALTTFFLFITNWHDTVGILVMTALLAGWMAWKRDWTWVLRVLLSVPLGMLLNVLLKNIFQRHRPSFDHPILTLVSYSFPSGHAAAATLFYGVLAAYLLTLTRRAWHLPVVLAAVCMVALVALSRVYLGVHYPSDVLAAMASSTAWLAIAFTGISTWRKRQAWLLRTA